MPCCGAPQVRPLKGCGAGRRQWLDAAHGTSAAAEMLAAASAEEAAAAAALGVRRVGAVEDLRCLDEDLDRCGAWGTDRWGLWQGC